MWIRIWSGNAILGDLEVTKNGTSSTWNPRPAMPNNDPGYPDLEIEPWAKYIRDQHGEVEEYGSGREPAPGDDDV